MQLPPNLDVSPVSPFSAAWIVDQSVSDAVMTHLNLGNESSQEPCYYTELCALQGHVVGLYMLTESSKTWFLILNVH